MIDRLLLLRDIGDIFKGEHVSRLQIIHQIFTYVHLLNVKETEKNMM